MKLKILAPLMIFVLLAGFAFAAVYTDVSPSHWAYDSIVRLTDLGILSGISEGGLYYFKGDDPLTRYQAAVLLDKFLTYLEEKGVSGASEAVSGEAIEKIREQLGIFETILKDQKGEYIDLADILGRLEKLEKEVADLQSKGIIPALGEGTDLKKFFDKLQSFGESVAELKRDLEGKFSELSENVNVLEKTLNATLSEIEVNLKTLNESVLGHSNEISGLSKRITAAGNRVATLENKVESLWNLTGSFVKTEEFKALEDRMTGVEAKLSEFVTWKDLGSKLEDYATVKDLEEMNTSISGLQMEVLGLKKRLDKVEESSVSKDSLAPLISELENLKTSTTDLEKEVEKKVESIDKALMFSGNKVDTLEGLKSDVETLKSIVAKLNKNTPEIENALKFLVDDVDTLNSTVTELSSQLVELRKDVPENINLEEIKKRTETAFWVGFGGIVFGIAGIVIGIIAFWYPPSP
ncbi:S-layer homology domain-containing protein [Kosmotoga olearia]|uniref:S-layer domain protein n=1 Tax=Kosmotoga olearia (strain ATCC BAA-1733 / DSM 21960 / TBF 19.5.1) TaxID=521045 RepID=C5CIU6_KOSOT|nr:S-layer homology domain-containing protein [Kosmotoga olearia]ACR78935.1 S-layer domain protein [Kosmotoga olearia TBF 19.5.1]